MKLRAEMLEALLHAAPDALIAVDDRGAVVYANDQTEQLFGWSKDELIGQNVELLVPDRFKSSHPDLRERYGTAPTARPMGTGLTLTALRRDGTEFPIEVSLSPIETSMGRLFAAAIRDVTVSRRREEKFRAVLDLAPDAVVGVDRSGRIVLANVQAERIFGWSPGELVGQPVEALLPTTIAERHVALREGYMADPVTRPMGAGRRLAARRRDGTVFTTEISLSAIENEDGEMVVLAAVRDVTERIELEADRQRQALAAERAQSHHLESLGQLTGGIAHDFNNLLGVILSYATLATRQDDREAVRADLVVIRQAAERAATLTKQLLAFGRRELVRPELVDANAVVADFARLLERTIGEHIEISVHVGDEPLVVLVDRNQLEQALLNLALNARDAMPRGGLLSITCKRYVVSRESTIGEARVAPGEYVRVGVADTGIGMSAEIARRAFEPFFTTKPRGSGTGLGLASTYGIVTQSQGVLAIDSEVGRGTTMSILLPAAEGEAVAPDDALLGSRATAGRVLLVEDEEALRKVAARMLREHGYDVVTASNGIEGLERLVDDQRRFDIVLTDIVMPKMSGKDLADEVHRRYPDLAVLFMTGYAEPGFDLRETELLIEKPFTEERLLAAVGNAFDAEWRRHVGLDDPSAVGD
jgi:PAS domain S-box-containing protein